MVSRKADLLVILLFQLNLGHPLLGIWVKSLLSAFTYRKPSIVCHKSLISKLPSYGLYPSLCTFISSFLSDRSIAAVVDGHCSSPETINNGVPQSSVLSPTLFLLSINDLLHLTQCPIHSFADDTTLHFSTSYNRRPTQQELNDSRQDAIGRLTSDLSLVSDWRKANLVLFKNSLSTTIYSI